MKVISSLARVLQKVLGIGFFFIWFEVRYFNFCMNKANCDWLTLILNMARLYQNKTINTLMVSALRSQQVQVEFEDSINTYGILDNTFQILDTENMSVTIVTNSFHNRTIWRVSQGFYKCLPPQGLHSVSPHFTIEPVLPSVAYPLIICSLKLPPLAGKDPGLLHLISDLLSIRSLICASNGST